MWIMVEPIAEILFGIPVIYSPPPIPIGLPGFRLFQLDSGYSSWILVIPVGF
jgi:hypothetical protein